VIPPTVGLSRRLHVPVLYLGARDLLPQDYFRIAWQMRGWVVEKRGDLRLVKHNDDRLLLTRTYMGTILTEWRTWKNYYLPDFDLRGKTVLDVGAG
jgi:hypothetical protein